MKTEQRIKEIAEELRTLVKSDNDALRFISENLSDFRISNIEDELRAKISNMSSEIEELEEMIDEARRALS